MTLTDLGYVLAQVILGVFLGCVCGFFYGHAAGRRTGKIEGWIYAYKELVTRLKAKTRIEHHSILKGTVLVADENDDVRQILVAVLKLYGYRVLEARSGREAIQVTAISSLDAAIINLELPEISGSDLAKLIRSDDRTSMIKLIAIIGPLEQDRHRAIDSGYDGFLSKPYQLDQLIKDLESL